MAIDTRSQSTEHLGWPQIPPAGTVREAQKLGKQLRVDCMDCGRRYFDLETGVQWSVFKQLWQRDDIKRKFQCRPKGRGKKCAIKTVGFAVWDGDVERFSNSKQPTGGAKSLR